MQTKSLVLGTALLCTLALTWHSYHQEAGATLSLPTRTVSEASLQHAKAVKAAPAVDLVLSQREAVAYKVDLFSSAYVPSAPVKRKQAPVQKAAAVAVAPALPFKYLGRWKDSQDALVMLSVDDEVLSVKAGDVLLNQYVVQSITDQPQGLNITFLYRPLNQTQQLFVGNAHHE